MTNKIEISGTISEIEKTANGLIQFQLTPELSEDTIGVLLNKGESKKVSAVLGNGNRVIVAGYLHISAIPVFMANLILITQK